MKRRRQVALNRYLQGATVREVAGELNVSPTTIGRDLKAVVSDLAKKNTPGAEELRVVMDARYNRLLLSVWPAATRTEVDEEGNRVSAYDGYAFDRAITLLPAIRQLNGLHGPPQKQVSHTGHDQPRIIIDWVDPPVTDSTGTLLWEGFAPLR